MTWILFALLHGLARAFSIDARRRFRAPPLTATLWQAGIAAALPLLFYARLDWGRDWQFYAAAVLTGCVGGVTLLIHDTLQNNKRGRIFGIYMPFEALFAFLIWFAITPSACAAFLADPLQSVSAGLSFLLAAVALSIMRAGDLNWQRLILAVVVGATAAIGSVVVKLALPDGRFDMTVVTFVFVQLLCNFIVLLFAATLKSQAGKTKPSANNVFQGVTGGLGVLGAHVSFVAGLIFAPNPGYVIFTAMLLPVWLLGLHKLHRAEETASPVAALLLVISTITLLLGALLGS